MASSLRRPDSHRDSSVIQVASAVSQPKLQTELKQLFKKFSFLLFLFFSVPSFAQNMGAVDLYKNN
jgi:hypothetical protein